jgi:hypothetical protein
LTDEEVTRFVEAIQRSAGGTAVLPGRLRHLAAEITEAARQWLGDSPSWPVIASLPSGELNAVTYKVPGGLDVHAVFFDEGLMHFTRLFSVAAVFALPPSGDGVGNDPAGLRRRLADDPAPAARFLEMLIAYVVGGDPLLADAEPVGERWAALGEICGDAMNLFVLGHEFGHVLARHLDASAPDDAWSQEFQADALGARLSVAALRSRGYDVDLCGIGAELFFGAVDVVDRAVSILRHGDERPRSGLPHTHPPTALRRRFYRTRVLPHVLPEEAVAPATAWCESAGLAVSLLWESARPGLVNLHRGGVRPAHHFTGG